MLYKPLLHCNSHLKQQTERFSFEVGVVDVNVCVLSHLKEELTWAIDKQLRVISTTCIMLLKTYIVLRS